MKPYVGMMQHGDPCGDNAAWGPDAGWRPTSGPVLAAYAKEGVVENTPGRVFSGRLFSVRE